MFLSYVDDQDIIRTVKNVKSEISTDSNDLNMSLVRNVIAHIIKPLKYTYNASFNTGIIPNQMKTAKVISIFKSGEKGVFTNHIPISLLQQFKKKTWKYYTVIGYIVFYLSIIYSALVNLDLYQTYQHHMA